MVKYNSRFTSENYQVMNYGVGGYISLHMDEHALPNFLSLCMGGGNTTDSAVMVSCCGVMNLDYIQNYLEVYRSSNT